MGIRLNTLNHAQVEEIIKLAESKAMMEALEEITRSLPLPMSHAVVLALQQLMTVIDNLSPAARSELLALTWLGMGTIDDDPRSWTQLLHVAQEDRINQFPEQLALMSRLHEYLYQGLEKVS